MGVWEKVFGICVWERKISLVMLEFNSKEVAYDAKIFESEFIAKFMHNLLKEEVTYIVSFYNNIINIDKYQNYVIIACK